jgi:hypothetical protein
MRERSSGVAGVTGEQAPWLRSEDLHLESRKND